MLPYLLLSTPGSPTPASGTTHQKRGSPAEMHEQPAEVLRILLDPVVLGLDVLALQEPQHVLLELSRPFSRDDLDQRRLLFRRLVTHRPAPRRRPVRFSSPARRSPPHAAVVPPAGRRPAGGRGTPAPLLPPFGAGAPGPRGPTVPPGPPPPGAPAFCWPLPAPAATIRI